MNVTEIPFVKKVGITRNDQDLLALPFSEQLQNHLQTLHASAQFTLAETASGEHLQNTFPELAGKVIPVLRDSHVKFKKPAVKSIAAYPTLSEQAIEKFNEQFLKKGRSTTAVQVEIKDGDNTVTCVSTFNWFVQRIDSMKEN